MMNHKRMMAWLFTAMTLAGLLATQTAQAQEVPFEGVITQDDVTLRAGAGTPYYIVGQAGQGVRVTVTERIADWYKITPPAGVYTYVSQGYVDVRGDGSSGTVRSRIPAYAASINGPGESYRRQMDLLAGEVVKIVGTDGSFFKIQPPQGAYVYVQTQFVTPAANTTTAAAPTEEPKQPQIPAQPAQPAQPTQPKQPVTPDAAQAQAAVEQATADTAQQAADQAQQAQTQAAQQVDQAKETAKEAVRETAGETQGQVAADAPEVNQPTATTTTQQVTQPTTQTDPQQAQAAATQADDTATQEPVVEVQTFTVVSPNLAAVEQLFIEAQRKPIEQQPLDTLRKQYTDLQDDVTLTPGDHRVRQARINQIERNITLAKAINDLRSTRQQVNLNTTRLEVTTPTATQTQYNAVGMLLASSVYDGTTLPRLYRLVNAGQGRTIAYVRASDHFDTAKALGSTVGIVGNTRYDTALKLRVIDVTHMDILSPASGE